MNILDKIDKHIKTDKQEEINEKMIGFGSNGALEIFGNDVTISKSGKSVTISKDELKTIVKKSGIM